MTKPKNVYRLERKNGKTIQITDGPWPPAQRIAAVFLMDQLISTASMDGEAPEQIATTEEHVRTGMPEPFYVGTFKLEEFSKLDEDAALGSIPVVRGAYYTEEEL